jgi:peptide/nickel transport system substrate-binding protein
LKAVVLAIALTISLVGELAMPAPTSGAASPSSRSTATWAEPAGTPPDYIFPFMSPQLFDASNVSQFQYLMYRPLYWFGKGATADLDPSLSLANEPMYSARDTSVTITLKPYRWSNGEKVTARDVMFWMNMLHAEKANWAAYEPGGDNIPDNVKDVTVDSPTKVTFQLTGPFNERWYTYNQLSQITPLPIAWDKTSLTAPAGSGGCSKGLYGTVDNQCAAVYTFLSEQAGYDPDDPGATNSALSTYATNKLWQVVDGPWRLQHFDAAGNLTFVPNPRYSGPVKPTLKKFVELPFSSDKAEYDALAAGKVDVGYLPTQDVTGSTGNPLKVGPNNPRLGDFRLAPLYTWSINYFPYNFDSTGDGGNAGPIFKQLYFRQAMQYLVDQPRDIEKLSHGYGIGTYGPVPVVPQDSPTPAESTSNPYRYNPNRAKALLAGHGWQVVPGGISTCRQPGTGKGECGVGITKGAKLAFTLQYASGTPIVRQTMDAEQSSWARAGIHVSLSAAPFDTVLGTATPCPKGCVWEMANWGSGWLFSPAHYPTGEEIFQTGGASNPGGYSSPTNDANIKTTMTSQVGLATYQSYLAEQLPVVFQPSYATAMTEIRNGLGGVTPQSVLWQLNPEAWRWTR